MTFPEDSTTNKCYMACAVALAPHNCTYPYFPPTNPPENPLRSGSYALKSMVSNIGCTMHAGPLASTPRYVHFGPSVAFDSAYLLQSSSVFRYSFSKFILTNLP